MSGLYALSWRDHQDAARLVREHFGLSLLMTGLCLILLVPHPSLLWVALWLGPLAAIDLRTQRLPDPLTASVTVLSLGYALFWAPDPGMRMAGALYVFSALLLTAWLGHRFEGRMALGGGDIKLALSFPLLIGFGPGCLALALATLTQVTLAEFTRRMEHPLPFGPALIFGALLAANLELFTGMVY